MPVGYFCLEPSWLFHFVHELDLIEEDLQASTDVHVIRPSSRMRFSDTYRRYDYRLRLPSDLRRFREGISLLSRDVPVHSVDQLALAAPEMADLQSMQWPTFQEHQELNEFRFMDHDCGNATLSSLIYHTRDAEVDLRVHGEWIRRAMETSILVYLAAKTFNRSFAPERVTVFNGRMSTFRGVLRACQQDSVDCLVHERGATLDRIHLTKNTLPHDIRNRGREIVDHWPKTESEQSISQKIGESYYQQKRDRKVFNWTVYTAWQEKGRLPKELDRAKKLYSLFTSSEYERTALPYFSYRLHETQLQGILDIVQVLKEGDFSGVLCIRIHPNSDNEKPCLLERLQRELKESFVTIIPATSPIDTYALIDASDKVISFGSTVSIEAAFWGKPSVLLGTSEFEDLEATYQPIHRSEFVHLMTADLAPKEIGGCLKLGYYNSTFGRKLKYAEVLGLQDLSFRGKRIQKRRFREQALLRGRKIWNRIRNGPVSGAFN